jgi:hypothetical protein
MDEAMKQIDSVHHGINERGVVSKERPQGDDHRSGETAPAALTERSR